MYLLNFQIEAQIPLDALTRSIQYLEMELPSMTDPYELAITAYALSLAKSVQATTAMQMLQNMATVEGKITATRINCIVQPMFYFIIPVEIYYWKWNAAFFQIYFVKQTVYRAD